MALGQFARLAISARIVVQDGGAQRPVRRVDEDGAVHLAGKADCRNLAHRRGRLARQGGQGVEHRSAPIVGILFRPKRPGMAGKIAFSRSAEDLLLFVDKQAFSAEVPQSTPRNVILIEPAAHYSNHLA